jgi:hypothetical protein
VHWFANARRPKAGAPRTACAVSRPRALECVYIALALTPCVYSVEPVGGIVTCIPVDACTPPDRADDDEVALEPAETEEEDAVRVGHVSVKLSSTRGASGGRSVVACTPMPTIVDADIG